MGLSKVVYNNHKKITNDMYYTSLFAIERFTLELERIMAVDWFTFIGMCSRARWIFAIALLFVLCA
jgi:hypothetical protein